MPIPFELCDEPDLCCPDVVTAGQAMLTTLTTALYECWDYDPDADDCGLAPFTVFFGFGQPSVALSDYLTAWVEFIQPDFFQQANAVSTRHLLPQALRVWWIFRLSLTGYPTFSSDGAVINDVDQTLLDRANRAMTSLATVMMTTLSGTTPEGCSDVQIERYEPEIGGGGVTGGSAGVSVRVSYTMRF